MDNCVLGFNGERLDPVNGAYHLGNGYRAYNPVLMRLNRPDSFSPFGAGGINPYAYCVGDPVNHTDPSGHLSWQAWLGIGMGIAGLGLAVFTVGASIAAAGGMMAAIESASAVSLAVGALGVASDITAIASGAAAESNPQASTVLGWVSLGTGAVGLASVVAGMGKWAVRAAGGIRAVPGSAASPGAFASRGYVWGWKTMQRINSMGYEDLEAARYGESPSVSFIFEDLHRGAPRLNVVAHGHLQTEPQTAYIFLDNVGERSYNGTGLADQLRDAGYRFESYESARTIVCNSGTGGIGSFAAQFAARTGLPTTGYLGDVATNAERLETVLVNAFMQARTEAMGMPGEAVDTFSLIAADRAATDWLSNYQGRAAFRVLKNTPGYNYNPITYFPDGKRIYRNF